MQEIITNGEKGRREMNATGIFDDKEKEKARKW